MLPKTTQNNLLELIETKSWAKQDFKNLQQKARDGDGYSAAFLYALTKEKQYLDPAKNWLLNFTSRGADIGIRALEVKDDFFDQGIPWLGDVFYRTDSRHLEAFDLLYDALNQQEKAVVLKGIGASAEFRQKSMDAWWQTANLVFKPTTMVAIAGLVTQNPEYLKWGFFRKPNSHIGGYFSTLNTMLKDNGPWHEAPIYAISHLPLYQSLKISELLAAMTGKDWFNFELAEGSSVRGLMDYYIASTYPRETRLDGTGRYRILTYGDGATGQRGDTYLISPNPLQRNLKRELALAYKLSKNPDYAALLKLFNDYQPNLIGRPELPASPLLPEAQSSIWSDFGLAFLRSDHSRNYWNNPNAIAASLLFRQGYGHGHADALSMTVFAAGQLFYPDFNAVQYENPAIGWTTSSVAHNTVVVDGNNSLNPKSVSTSHTFSDEFRYVQATVDEPLGLSKTRTLALTPDYLLDVFHLNSLTPRTCDYLLHSFGRIQVKDDSLYKASKPFSTRYKNIRNFNSSIHDDSWELDFIIDSKHSSQNTKRIASQFIDENNSEEQVNSAFGLSLTNDEFRSSKLNFTMNGSPNTQVGTGVDDYGLSFLIARRENVKQTTFATLHSPSYMDEKPAIQNTIQTLIDADSGSVIKVITDTHIDLHAISHQHESVFLQDKNNLMTLGFSDYAVIRINKQTKQITTHGDWQHYFIAKQINQSGQDISFGEPGNSQQNSVTLDSSQLLQVDTFPEVAVLKDFADSEFTLSLTNKTDKPVSIEVQLQNIANFEIPNKNFSLGIIPAYRTAHQKIKLKRYKQTGGIDILPFKIIVKNSNQVINHGVLVSTGPGLMRQFEGLDEPIYRIHTFDSTIDVAMRDGFIRQVSNADENHLSNQILFDLSDGETVFSSANNTIETSYTWADESTGSILSELNNLIRWNLFPIQNRFYVKLDKVYTRLDQVFFLFNKNNSSFDWSNAKLLKNGERLALTGSKPVATNAVEIPFKDSDKSLCIKTTQVKAWANSNKHLSFSLTRNDADQFGFGVCDQHSLANWAN